MPVGVFLSGGIDSALIGAIATQESGAAIKTFTIDYDVGGVGEARTAGRTATRLGAEHHEVLFRAEQVREDVPAVLARLDEPHRRPGARCNARPGTGCAQARSRS